MPETEITIEEYQDGVLVDLRVETVDVDPFAPEETPPNPDRLLAAVEAMTPEQRSTLLDLLGLS